jgi:threonyl-tRNA synthetase
MAIWSTLVSFPIDTAMFAQLAIITDNFILDADGSWKSIRHSTAHLLAYAVKELFPEAQVTIGPVIENGFYYDFAYKRPFTPGRSGRHRKAHGRTGQADFPVEREVWERDDIGRLLQSRSASITRPS